MPSTHQYTYRLPVRSRRDHSWYSSPQTCFSRVIVVADRPAASGPRMAARASGKSFVEIPLQVKHRDQRLDARRPPHIRRQDATGELLPRPPIVHPRLPNPDVTQARLDRPSRLITIPHHQPMSSSHVCEVAVFRHVARHLGLDRRLKHSPGSLAEQFLQCRPRFLFSPSVVRLITRPHERILSVPLARGLMGTKCTSPKDTLLLTHPELLIVSPKTAQNRPVWQS